MSIIWADCFDQYGGDETLVSQFGYSFAASFQLDQTTPRTGTTCFVPGGTNAPDGIRAALDVPLDVIGTGVASRVGSFYEESPGRIHGVHFLSAGPFLELSVVPKSDASIQIYDRTGTHIGGTTGNAITVDSYQWWEMKVTKNTGLANTGSIEFRIPGKPPLIINGINLPNQFAFTPHLGAPGNFPGGDIKFDDWVVWDANGSDNNDFMGDYRLDWNPANANLALQDFVPNPAGNAYQRVGQTPPVDTSYIEGAAVGNVSEFGKTPQSIISNQIAAVVAIGRMFKPDAGVSAGKIGLNSASNIALTDESFPGTTGTWFRKILERNPNGNAMWTKLANDAAALRIAKTS